ncbi:MAG: rhomboid family intramembrane serine protease [Mangrovibacterium sp.]
MKTYLKSNRPEISLILIMVLFLSNILTLFIPKLSEIVLLYPSNLFELLNWYRLITYPLYVGGLLTWIYNSLVILFIGFIIENKLKKQDLIGLIILSSIIGGLIFMIINHGKSYDIPIATPTMISWGYWSASIIIGLRFWRTLNLFEKIVIILCFLSVISIENENFGFLLGQLTVILTIAILTLIKCRKYKQTGRKAYTS